MKTIFLALALVLPSLSFAHDHAKPDTRLAFTDGTHAHLFWETGPVESDESILRIEFMNGATHTATDIAGSVEVTIRMPSMDHGAPPTVIEKVTDSTGAAKVGVYRVSGIYFLMDGEWEVSLKLNNPDGTSETQTFTVEIDGDGNHHGHH